MVLTSRNPQVHRPAPRRAFTMVELLVVILIIAILIGLLVPAIAAAVRTVNKGRCTADINSLVAALTQFKSTFQDYPPSRIALYESCYYNPSDNTLLSSVYGDGRSDITLGTLNQRSARYLQKFFPRAATFNTVSPGSYGPIDINFDGQYGWYVNGSFSAAVPIILTGDECLVFFLGGLANFTTGSSGEQVIGMGGFSRNPANPFDRSTTSRTDQLFQFAGGRLVDFDNDGMPSYLDTYGSGSDPSSRSYAFFSAYGNGNYDPNDCSTLASGADPLGGPKQVPDPHSADDAFMRVFNATFPSGGPGNSCYAAGVVASTGANPYTASAPFFQTGQTVVWQNPNTFQIISAGADQKFGIGGSYSSTSNAGTLAFPDKSISVCAGSGTPAPDRSVENDNLSNFASGSLQ